MGTHYSLTVPIPTKSNKVSSANCTFLLLVQGINEVMKLVMGIKEDDISERIFFLNTKD